MVKVLVACEFSGVVREAFRELGHDAYSCDLLPALDNSPYHYQCDVLTILDKGWDLMIAHPPCTYLASSGLHWNKRIKGRAEKTELALDLVCKLLTADIDKIALENPVGVISRLAKPSQVIHPWQFGHNESKTTCLWLKNLPLLVPTDIINDKNRDNTYNTGQNKVGPHNRALLRSITYIGIAKAMAKQWEI